MEILLDLQAQINGYYKNIIVILPRVAIGIVLTAIIYFTIRFLRLKAKKYLIGRVQDPLFINFISRVVSGINIISSSIFFLYVIGFEGIAASILAAAGVSAFVIGFAFKDIGENFLAGVIMAFKRPFRIGDTIETNGVVGTILAMTIRDTHLKTFDGKDVFVPNGQILKNPFFNYTIDGFLRQDFIIGIDYNSDIQTVRNIIEKTLSGVKGVLDKDKKPVTILSEFASSTVNIEIQFWLDTFDKSISGVEVKTQAMQKVYEALSKANISMPGNVVELKNYNERLLISN